MDFSLVIPTFLAGILTFLAPCTLPLVPGYLGFISNVSSDDLSDPVKARKAKRKVFLNGVFFILGFSIVFILFGVLAGLFGGAVSVYRVWLTRIGGVFVILFGLFMLGLLRLPVLNAEKGGLKVPKILERGKYSSSLALGSAFGIGWTPCVGPVLGSVLILASTSTTALQGGFLLAVFSVGLAIPFLLVALGIGSATERIKKITKYLGVISKIGGVFLILLGILLVFDRMSLLLSYGFQLLEFLNYDAIVDYL
jgi:cytochrome c-type biogenesis protein